MLSKTVERGSMRILHRLGGMDLVAACRDHLRGRVSGEA